MMNDNNEAFVGIRCQGSGAAVFLQGLVTRQPERADQSVLSAFCNRQGKVIALVVYHIHDDEHQLYLPASLAPILSQHIKYYARFAKVRLVLTDPVYPGAHWQMQSQASDWQRACVEQQVAFLTASSSGLYTVHMLAYPQLGVINWQKGCYLGQEIVVRTQHRGQVKRLLVTWQAAALPADVQPILTVAEDDGYKGLAVMSEAQRLEYAAMVVAVAGESRV